MHMRLAFMHTTMLWCAVNALTTSSTAVVDFKYVIVGAGPAGLQMAKHMQDAGRSYVVVEKTVVASAFVKYPIHRQLISVNKMYAGEGEGREFNMRHDWNSLLYTNSKDLDSVPPPSFIFRNYSSDYLPHADHLVEYLRDYATHYRLNIREHTTVVDVLRDTRAAAVNKKHRLFTLHLKRANGTMYTLRCERIVWATGLQQKSVADDIFLSKSSKFIHYSDLNVSLLSMFANKKVAIMGKGNAGMETASSIMPFAGSIDMRSRNPVKRAVDTHYTGDVRVMNSNPLGGYQLKSLVSLLDSYPQGSFHRAETEEDTHLSNSERVVLRDYDNGTVDAIKHNLETGESRTINLVGTHATPHDYVVSCIGFDSANDVLYRDGGRNWKYLGRKEMLHIQRRKKTPAGMERVHLRDISKFPQMQPWYESSDVDGLYFAGAQMHGRDYKRGNNGFIHGFRYSVRVLHRWMEQEVEDVSWPAEWGSDEPWELTGRIHHRIRTSSGLYQMFGVMCDVFVYSEAGHLSSGRFTEPSSVAHVFEVPCDMVPHLIERHWRFKDAKKKRRRVRFLTVSLDYARCYKDEAVIIATRFCAMNNFGCFSQTNFLHPIVRYYDSPATEDLRQRTKDEFEHRADREFHLAEDLATTWDAQDPFWVSTLQFLERVDMERRGMSRELAPILLMERDTSVPITNCEFYKLGEYFYNKANEFFMQAQDIKNSRKKGFLNVPRKDRDSHIEMLDTNERKYSVMHEFFLTQALKLKPLLWKKIWRGYQLVVKKSDDKGMFVPGNNDDIYHRAEQLFVFSLAKRAGTTALTCATPTMSVSGCLGKWMESQGLNSSEKMISSPRDSWFHEAVFSANATNSLKHGGARTPCFARYSCKKCLSDRCGWCFSSSLCISKSHGKCPLNHTSDVFTCATDEKSEEVPIYEHFWKDDYPNVKQTYNAMLTRMEVHPSNHDISIEFNTRDDVESELNQDINAKCSASGSSSCVQCTMDKRCAWCSLSNECVHDVKGECPGNRTEHIGLNSGTFICPKVADAMELIAKNASVTTVVKSFDTETFLRAQRTIEFQDMIERDKIKATTTDFDTLPRQHTGTGDVHLLLNTTEHVDYVVVGAGPGGLQMAQFLQEKNRSYTVLEKNSTAASSFQHYPRHRKLISTNKMYAGKNRGREFHMRHDWNSLLHTVQDLDEVPPAPIQFKNYSTDYFPHADTLVEYMNDFSRHYDLNIRYNSEVLALFRQQGVDDQQKDEKGDLGRREKKSQYFFVNVGTAGSKQSWIRCNNVIWATGYMPHELFDTLDAPTDRIIRYADFDVGDLEKFANKKVQIIGKGNSAMEVADSIMPYVATLDMSSRNIPKRAVTTHYTGDIREMNEAAIGGYQLKSLVSLLDGMANHYDIKSTNEETTILKLRFENPISEILNGAVTAEPKKHEAIGNSNSSTRKKRGEGKSKNSLGNMQYVIQCAGFDSNLTVFTNLDKRIVTAGSVLLEQVRLPTTGDAVADKFPAMKPWYESSSVEGLYFAGAQMHGRDYKRGNNGFIHGFRYSIRALHKWMEQENENIPWPVQWGGDEPWELTGRIHQRIRTTSGLYQMFGVMCDLFVFSEGHKVNSGRHSDPIGVAYIQEMPCDMVPDVIERKWRHRSASGKKQHVRFMTLTLDYDRCYKDVAVFAPTRLCEDSNKGCFSQSNFLHPILRYYDSPGSEDLRLQSAKDFESKATRENHLVEDLATRWDANGFPDHTRLFLERISMLRKGYNRSQAPLLLSERDTLEALPDCEMEQIGDLLLGKAAKLFNKYGAITLSDLSKNGKNPEIAAMYKFFVAQSLKYKPNLWRKIFSQRDNMDQENNFLTGHHVGGPRSQVFGETLTENTNLFDLLYTTAKDILDQTKLKRQLQKLKLKKALKAEINSSPTVCSTPGFSVSGCLRKRHDIMRTGNEGTTLWTKPRSTKIENNGIINPFKWLEKNTFQPNTTNMMSHGDQSPCFVYSHCFQCASVKGCSWCPTLESCTSEGFCPHNDNPFLRAIHRRGNHTAAACVVPGFKVARAKEVFKEGKEETLEHSKWSPELFLFDTESYRHYLKYLTGDMQQLMAFEHRLNQHPNDHSESFPSNTARSMLHLLLNNTKLWQTVSEMGEILTDVVTNRVGKKYLEEQKSIRSARIERQKMLLLNSDSDSAVVAPGSVCKDATSCSACLLKTECAWCLGEGVCTMDVSGNCASRADHVRRVSVTMLVDYTEPSCPAL